jgi:hypothetical protein
MRPKGEEGNNSRMPEILMKRGVRARWPGTELGDAPLIVGRRATVGEPIDVGTDVGHDP